MSRLRHPIKIAALFLFLAALLGAALFALLPPNDPLVAPKSAPEPPERTQPEPSLSGRVLAPDARPIEGARVRARPIVGELRAGGALARSGPDGAFAFEALAPGDWLIAAEHPELPAVAGGPRALREVQITLTPGGQPIADLELTLGRPAEIAGRVVAGARPAPDASLSLAYESADGIAGRLTEPFALDLGAASTDGTFASGPVPPGRARVLAYADGFAGARSRLLALNPGDSIEGLVLDLAPSGSLIVRVRDAKGRALEGAEVIVSAPDLGAPRAATTGPSGNALLSELRAGPLRLAVRAEGHQSAALEAEIAQDETRAVEARLEPASGLFGAVAGPGGAPYDGAAVEVRRGPAVAHIARTGADGRFAWAEAPAGTYTLTAYAPTAAPSAPRSAETGRAALLELGPGATLTGLVRARSGRPVSSYRLAVEQADFDGPRYHAPSAIEPIEVRRADGRFSLGPLRPGTYYLRAKPERLAAATSPPAVARASGSAPVTIVVDEAGGVRGSVRGADGQPLVNALIEAFSPTSPFPPVSTRTAPDGSFALANITPGRTSLRASAPGHLTQVASGVPVPPGGTVRYDLALERAEPGAAFSFQGIGATLAPDERGARIQAIMPGSAAATYGLQKGDLVTAIDGESARGLRLGEVVERIRGEQGAPVRLAIERGGVAQLVEVVRGRVVVKNRSR